MISYDLECKNGHRFEGIFSDYSSFCAQRDKKMIQCPICNDSRIKQLFTGCSIQGKSSIRKTLEKEHPTLLESLRIVEQYVKDNFENVGKDFPDTARAIYYGIEKERNIYGETTRDEIKDLVEEGIPVLPLPGNDKMEN
ncbi:MAG: DUF1178 family protein [Spirochaetota bacterium]